MKFSDYFLQIEIKKKNKSIHACFLTTKSKQYGGGENITCDTNPFSVMVLD
jgi:hypothetical protein